MSQMTTDTVCSSRNTTLLSYLCRDILTGATRRVSLVLTVPGKMSSPLLSTFVFFLLLPWLSLRLLVTSLICSNLYVHTPLAGAYILRNEKFTIRKLKSSLLSYSSFLRPSRSISVCWARYGADVAAPVCTLFKFNGIFAINIAWN